MITELNLGTVRQNQDAETLRLSRKTERRSWPKREGVWPKRAFCGQNVKNAGQKKIYYGQTKPLLAADFLQAISEREGKQYYSMPQITDSLKNFRWL